MLIDPIVVSVFITIALVWLVFFLSDPPDPPCYT